MDEEKIGPYVTVLAGAAVAVIHRILKAEIIDDIKTRGEGARHHTLLVMRGDASKDAGRHQREEVLLPTRREKKSSIALKASPSSNEHLQRSLKSEAGTMTITTVTIATTILTTETTISGISKNSKRIKELGVCTAGRMMKKTQ